GNRSATRPNQDHGRTRASPGRMMRDPCSRTPLDNAVRSTAESAPGPRGIPHLQLDYSVLGAFALLWLAIVPTPGPNSLLIVHLALTAGWRDVAVALLGNLLAIAFYAIATLVGLALLLAAAPSVRL